MLRRFFRGKDSRTPVARLEPAAANVTAAVAEQPAAGPEPTLAEYERALRTLFTDQVEDRIADLASSLSPAERAGDAGRFLDSLRGPTGTMIRQPPAAAHRALALTRDPDVGGGAIVRLIEQDPSLSQALLKFANSAYYATASTSCVSVHIAVQRVGTTGVQNLVLARMVEGLLCRPGSAYQSMVDQVWMHMVRTAPVARVLAPEFGLHADAAFALGLLHDVGKLVVFDRLGTLRATLRRDLDLPRSLVSRVLAQLHEPLGALAALEWSLGGMGARAIGTHHRSPVPDDPGLGSELLFLAERLDLAQTRGEPVDLETWCDQGGLLSRRDRVARVLAAAEGARGDGGLVAAGPAASRA
jgi:HD-like signal output (HDOD) protein